MHSIQRLEGLPKREDVRVRNGGIVDRCQDLLICGELDQEAVDLQVLAKGSAPFRGTINFITMWHLTSRASFSSMERYSHS